MCYQSRFDNMKIINIVLKVKETKNIQEAMKELLENTVSQIHLGFFEIRKISIEENKGWR